MITSVHQPGDIVNGHQLNEDGTAWLPVGPPPAPEKKKGKGKKIALGVVAAILVLGVAGAMTGGSEEPAQDQTTVSAPADTTTDEAPVDAPEADTAPEMTVSQENAVEKAESYIDMTGFSKEGLIDQLKFEGFSTADAEFAVNYLEDTGAVDWNEEAVQKAESYLEFSSFSRSGLIEQLEYEGFTSAQAEYAADEVGL